MAMPSSIGLKVENQCNRFETIILQQLMAKMHMISTYEELKLVVVVEASNQ